MADAGKIYQIQYPTTVSGKVYNVRDVSGEQNVAGKVYQVASVNGGGGTTIRNQDKQITENGTYTADAGYTGLGTVTVNVPSGGGSSTKFGASVDTWLGDVDENGVLQTTTWTGVLNFAEVKKIVKNGLNYTFHSCTGIKSVNLSSLQNVDDYGLYYTFSDCTGITSLDLSSLQSVGLYGMSNAFYGCTGITSLDLSSLQSVGIGGLYRTFYGCTGLTTMSFPSLTSVQSTTFNATFATCPALTEIHFRADMQATIEALSGYSSKFGATNATIYFDL